MKKSHWMLLALVLLSAVAGFGQSPEEAEASDLAGQLTDSELSAQSVASAEQLIAVLRQNPDLRAEVKKLALAQLRSQGRMVSESQLTDTALYARIQDDVRVRVLLTRHLLEKGYLNRDDFPELAASLGDEQADDDTPQLKRRTGAAARKSAAGEEDEDGPLHTGARNSRSTSAHRTALARKKPRPDVVRVPAPYARVPALDDLYAQFRRQDANLERFGTSLFANAPDAGADTVATDLPAGDDYVLGSGDGLSIVLYGGVSQSLKRTIDREGRIALPEVGSVVIAGNTIGQAEQTVERALSAQFQDVKADISLTRVRTIRVYVVGDVERPGAYDISSLSTPLNALIVAGGPTPRGSYRIVRHMRGTKLVAEVDLYEFMLKGVRSDTQRLQPGDTVLVPPAGPQVTIAGMVRRPAIYELHAEETLQQALELAGGVQVTGAYRQISVERIQAHEKRVMLTLNLPESGDLDGIRKALNDFRVQDGDKVAIAPINPYSEKAVYLDGHVIRPGKYTYVDGMKVTDLIRSHQDLMPEPSDHAEIVRLVPPDMRPTTIEFNLAYALAGDEKLVLQPFDTIRVFGRYEIDAPKVEIWGEVLRPGEYPLTQGMTAAQLVRMAGGFKRSAQTEFAELSSYITNSGKKVQLSHRRVEIAKALSGEKEFDVLLKPGDVLSIHQITGWKEIGASVTISGEVVHPGTYGIKEGEKLSALLKRVGGFREGAYPQGAVLERAQVRELDQRSREALIRRMEAAQPTGKGAEAAALTSAFVQQQQLILQRLKSQRANGRMVIKISPDISNWENTPSDIELRAGDVLAIPKKPSFVLVEGQVNNPSAMTFTPGKSAKWYLQRSGGATEFANKKQIFIIRADGSVVGNNGMSGWFTGNVLSTVMQPGDTIVVPEKILTESAFWKNALNTAQIMSSVAIAAKVAAGL